MLKKTITQDNIYAVWQFANVHGIAMILLFIRKKIQDMAVQFFLLNPNLQTTFFLSSLGLHGLSLRKNLINNHSTFILSLVLIWIKHLGFTKSKCPTACSCFWWLLIWTIFASCAYSLWKKKWHSFCIQRSSFTINYVHFELLYLSSEIKQ